MPASLHILSCGVCVCVCVCVCLQRPEKGGRSSGAGVMGACGLLSVGAGN
jgi:preprotein translocase subunit SecG